MSHTLTFYTASHATQPHTTHTLTLSQPRAHPHRSHELKTALERVANKLKEVDSERKELINQIRDLEKDVIILRRTNEESIRLRSIAMEERSKVSY